MSSSSSSSTTTTTQKKKKQKRQVVACWKTALDVWSAAAAPPNNNDDPHYTTVPIPTPAAEPHHAVHGHLQDVPGFVESYHLYRPLLFLRHDNNNVDEQEVLVAVIRVGRCLGGHPGQLHGGVASLLVDDVAGFAAEIVTRQPGAATGADGALVTAHLAIDYLAAVPTDSTILVQVRQRQRRQPFQSDTRQRKLWFAVQITNVQQTIVYATANVLYVKPKQGRQQQQQQHLLRARL